VTILTIGSAPVIIRHFTAPFTNLKKTDSADFRPVPSFFR